MTANNDTRGVCILVFGVALRGKKRCLGLRLKYDPLMQALLTARLVVYESFDYEYHNIIIAVCFLSLSIVLTKFHKCRRIVAMVQ